MMTLRVQGSQSARLEEMVIRSDAHSIVRRIRRAKCLVCKLREAQGDLVRQALR